MSSKKSELPGGGVDDSGQAASDASVAEPSAVDVPAARPTFPIVGIGASAGGLEALEALTARLIPDGMALVVLQHLAPGHDSALTDILARSSALRVLTVQDGMHVEPNHVYVTPPNVDLAIHNGVFRLMTPPVRRGLRLAIDAFFRTLAEEQGALAIGVVLSGAGSDGTVDRGPAQHATERARRGLRRLQPEPRRNRR
jgi:two-component system CheB/CheR fusion protein